MFLSQGSLRIVLLTLAVIQTMYIPWSIVAAAPASEAAAACIINTCTLYPSSTQHRWREGEHGHVVLATSWVWSETEVHAREHWRLFLVDVLDQLPLVGVQNACFQCVASGMNQPSMRSMRFRRVTTRLNLIDLHRLLCTRGHASVQRSGETGGAG